MKIEIKTIRHVPGIYINSRKLSKSLIKYIEVIGSQKSQLTATEICKAVGKPRGIESLYSLEAKGLVIRENGYSLSGSGKRVHFLTKFLPAVRDNLSKEKDEKSNG